MSEVGFGVDVIITDNKRHPLCPHGPTLLFEKYCGSGKTGRRFYACSAFRDRKDCSFFQWADEVVSDAKQTARDERYKQCAAALSSYSAERISKIRALSPAKRAFCHTCGVLILLHERTQHGNKHRVTSPVTDEHIRRPTTLFLPLDNNKTFAQYLFGRSSVKFTVDILHRLGFTRVLCVGAPRIHEEIQCIRGESPQGSLHSLLLDLDHRFEQIWPSDLFCRYNMFNHHFFGGTKSEEVFTTFVKGSDSGEKLVIVMDPPFGGMVEALGATLRKISAVCRDSEELCPVLWFFPYFMEKRILEVCPSLKMLDYKVDYDNHSLFHGGEKGRKAGSPVRIFTNLPPATVVLPESEGYWFCVKCQSYSSVENRHCEECRACTSKDGKQYVHCSECGRCVKPSRVHCPTCGECRLPQHTCGQQEKQGCHICGDMDHKRRECPQKNKSSNSQLKRKGDAARRNVKKRKNSHKI